MYQADCHSSDDPSVTIGLSLGTSSPKLSLDSEEPFYITVTARVLTTPDTSRSITLQAQPSPLGGLDNHAFSNFICTTNPDKFIQIYPIHRNPLPGGRGQNLREHNTFVTIPPPDQGTCTVRFAVPRDRIQEAKLESGERYKAQLTNKCLGTRWWSFGSLDDLEGIRLKSFESSYDKKVREDDPEFAQEQDEERRQKYGDGPSSGGEDPRMLAMVAEDEVEFEIA